MDAAETFHPDVILLDIGLPKLNGLDVCRRIRQQPWGQGIVMVALTGWGQEDDRRKSQQAGFDHHMVKPLDYNELMKLLASLDANHRDFPGAFAFGGSALPTVGIDAEGGPGSTNSSICLVSR